MELIFNSTPGSPPSTQIEWIRFVNLLISFSNMDVPYDYSNDPGHHHAKSDYNTPLKDVLFPKREN
jgi:hypothetical protein